MLKKITKYVAVIVCIFLVDFLLKNIYIKNPIYELKTTHYIFNIMDFVRIIIFMGILIYFGIYHNKNMTKASKIVFCILISASLIYIMERSIFRKIHYYFIIPLNITITFAGFLFIVGWTAEVVLLIIHSRKIDKDIKKIQKERIDNLK